MKSEIQQRADFSQIRYAQCWEDADRLLEGLLIRQGDVCVSIASAGDNSFAMLAAGAEKVFAVDLNPAQIACVELRIAAYKELKHSELLELIGSSLCTDREKHYQRCRTLLSRTTREFWDSHANDIRSGIGNAGKFERYFKIFRTSFMPLIHSRRTILELLKGSQEFSVRSEFYEQKWDNWRWRLLFKIFFSRSVMGYLGRDPEFFRYVKENVAERILERTRFALTELNPAENPYLQWILTGTHLTAFPYALRKENFDAIRNNLHKLDFRCCSLEELLVSLGERSVDKFNMSDIFEYMSEENYQILLEKIVKSARNKARLVYWNMLVPRHRPKALSAMLQPLVSQAKEIYLKDRAFFYSDYVLEEVIA